MNEEQVDKEATEARDALSGQDAPRLEPLPLQDAVFPTLEPLSVSEQAIRLTPPPSREAPSVFPFAQVQPQTGPVLFRPDDSSIAQPLASVMTPLASEWIEQEQRRPLVLSSSVLAAVLIPSRPGRVRSMLEELRQLPTETGMEPPPSQLTPTRPLTTELLHGDILGWVALPSPLPHTLEAADVGKLRRNLRDGVMLNPSASQDPSQLADFKMDVSYEASTLLPQPGVRADKVSPPSSPRVTDLLSSQAPTPVELPPQRLSERPAPPQALPTTQNIGVSAAMSSLDVGQPPVEPRMSSTLSKAPPLPRDRSLTTFEATTTSMDTAQPFLSRTQDVKPTQRPMSQALPLETDPALPLPEIRPSVLLEPSFPRPLSASEPPARPSETRSPDQWLPVPKEGQELSEPTKRSTLVETAPAGLEPDRASWSPVLPGVPARQRERSTSLPILLEELSNEAPEALAQPLPTAPREAIPMPDVRAVPLVAALERLQPVRSTPSSSSSVRPSQAQGHLAAAATVTQEEATRSPASLETSSSRQLLPRLDTEDVSRTKRTSTEGLDVSPPNVAPGRAATPSLPQRSAFVDPLQEPTLRSTPPRGAVVATSSAASASWLAAELLEPSSPTAFPLPLSTDMSSGQQQTAKPVMAAVEPFPFDEQALTTPSSLRASGTPTRPRADARTILPEQVTSSGVALAGLQVTGAELSPKAPPPPQGVLPLPVEPTSLDQPLFQLNEKGATDTSFSAQFDLSSQDLAKLEVMQRQRQQARIDALLEPPQALPRPLTAAPTTRTEPLTSTLRAPMALALATASPETPKLNLPLAELQPPSREPEEPTPPSPTLPLGPDWEKLARQLAARLGLSLDALDPVRAPVSTPQTRASVMPEWASRQDRSQSTPLPVTRATEWGAKPLPVQEPEHPIQPEVMTSTQPKASASSAGENLSIVDTSSAVEQGAPERPLTSALPTPDALRRPLEPTQDGSMGSTRTFHVLKLPANRTGEGSPPSSVWRVKGLLWIPPGEITDPTSHLDAPTGGFTPAQPEPLHPERPSEQDEGAEDSGGLPVVVLKGPELPRQTPDELALSMHMAHSTPAPEEPPQSSGVTEPFPGTFAVPPPVVTSSSATRSRASSLPEPSTRPQPTPPLSSRSTRDAQAGRRPTNAIQPIENPTESPQDRPQTKPQDPQKGRAPQSPSSSGGPSVSASVSASVSPPTRGTSALSPNTLPDMPVVNPTEEETELREALHDADLTQDPEAERRIRSLKKLVTLDELVAIHQHLDSLTPGARRDRLEELIKLRRRNPKASLDIDIPSNASPGERRSALKALEALLRENDMLQEEPKTESTPQETKLDRRDLAEVALELRWRLFQQERWEAEAW